MNNNINNSEARDGKNKRKTRQTKSRLGCSYETKLWYKAQETQTMHISGRRRKKQRAREFIGVHVKHEIYTDNNNVWFQWIINVIFGASDYQQLVCLCVRAMKKCVHTSMLYAFGEWPKTNCMKDKIFNLSLVRSRARDRTNTLLIICTHDVAIVRAQTAEE